MVTGKAGCLAAQRFLPPQTRARSGQQLHQPFLQAPRESGKQDMGISSFPVTCLLLRKVEGKAASARPKRYIFLPRSTDKNEDQVYPHFHNTNHFSSFLLPILFSSLPTKTCYSKVCIRHVWHLAVSMTAQSQAKLFSGICLHPSSISFLPQLTFLQCL